VPTQPIDLLRDPARDDVKKRRAIRRHWTLVCCAFSFCWQALLAEYPGQPAPLERVGALLAVVVTSTAAPAAATAA
jgi:hypothetical protein